MKRSRLVSPEELIHELDHCTRELHLQRNIAHVKVWLVMGPQKLLMFKVVHKIKLVSWKVIVIRTEVVGSRIWF